MNLFAAFAASSRTTRAEEAVSRLLKGIETGEASGPAAETYRAALRRHGRVIAAIGGPEALEAATDRLSDVPGRAADRRAVLTKVWADLDGAAGCDRETDRNPTGDRP